MPDPAATTVTLNQTTNRAYSIERFYSLVAGASEDRIAITLREGLRDDALQAAYTVEAWLEEIKGREEKYDRLANLARAVAPITDLLRTLSTGIFAGCYADLVQSYEEKTVRSILAQRYELRQSASEMEEDEEIPAGEDILSVLKSIVGEPEGRDDYVAWFQIGWLSWKRGDLLEAESAFRTAASFSQRHSQWYFAQSLRHEAFIQWKRENFERARGTIRRALEIRRDPSLLLEAARYAMSCGQSLESQSCMDEALHADPLIFVSVLADPTFANAVTTTMDILVRQQTCSSEHARSERDRWEEVIKVLRAAEKQGEIGLLPDDADTIFASAALSNELDFPTAIYRAEQSKTYRSGWLRSAIERVKADVASKKQALDQANDRLRTAKADFNRQLDEADKEQRIAEVKVQDEHRSVILPIVPQLKEELAQGFVVGLAVIAVCVAILAGLSQWRFGSIPPLQPIPTIDSIIVSPILAILVVFGLFGGLTFPLINISKASAAYRTAANAADERANQQLREIANDGTRKRDILKKAWAGQELELHSKIDEAQRQFHASSSAQITVKQLSH